jgi:hypothetical protein
VSTLGNPWLLLVLVSPGDQAVLVLVVALLQEATLLQAQAWVLVALQQGQGQEQGREQREVLVQTSTSTFPLGR